MYTDHNLTMLTDLYQLTMMQGYFKFHAPKKLAVFDLFYRTNPFDAAFLVVAGLDQVIDYIENLHFSPEDVEYLRSLHLFEEDFLQYLSEFRFTGELYALPEGSIAFPGEPLIRVKAPLMQAQLIETAILCLINHQSLIATKAVRVNWAAKGDPVMEFGLRRAQGPDAGTLGARAAVIGGCCGTNPEYIKALKDALADKKYQPSKSQVDTIVCSASSVVEVNHPRIIGERINPTGKKLFKQALVDNNIDI